MLCHYGFAIKFDKEENKPLYKLAVALAGPMVNIILSFIISSLPEFSLKATMVYTNLLIAIFNLIPIFPLDGGRAVEAGLKCFVKSNVASEIVHKVSNLCLVIFTVIGTIGMIWLKNIAIGAIVRIFVGDCDSGE